MSKVIKQMEMDALKHTFGEVRDLVLLTESGVSSQVDNQLRLALRKKNIRIQMIKRSLGRRVFDELGFKFSKPWEGTTVLAWGANSIAELCREIEDITKKNDKYKIKSRDSGGAVSEGVEIPFDRAKTMPTREEAIARVIGLALAPASRLISQIKAPAARVVSQIRSLKDRAPAEEAAPAAPPAPAT
jgi:ribosomal protein L10